MTLQSSRPEAIQHQLARLLVATADGSDISIDGSVQQMLRVLREELEMDVVFVAEFSEGRRYFRHVDHGAGHNHVQVGASDAVEASWCQRVVDGRLPRFMRDSSIFQESGEAPVPPFKVGTHMSVPIVLSDGHVYGTLCCFSQTINGKVNEDDLRSLSYSALLTAGQIERKRQRPH